jgi:hypothetical protein
MYFIKAEIKCQGLATKVPVSTSTISGTRTRSTVTTYTSTITSEEPILLQAEGITWMWLIPIPIAIVIVAAVLLKRRKPPVRSRTQQSCSGCGASLGVDDDFCVNCGKKRDLKSE